MPGKIRRLVTGFAAVGCAFGAVLAVDASPAAADACVKHTDGDLNLGICPKDGVFGLAGVKYQPFDDIYLNRATDGPHPKNWDLHPIAESHHSIQTGFAAQTGKWRWWRVCAHNNGKRTVCSQWYQN